MVAPIYINRKGIYKDLYREIDANNKKKEASQARKPRKGIYVALYRQLEEDKQKLAFKNNQNNLYILAFKKLFNYVSSKASCCFSLVKGEIRILIAAFMVVKKPVNSYIQNKL